MSTAAERHYTVAEVAERWRVSENTIIRRFRDQPGVLNIGIGKKVALRIPESVLSAYHEQRSAGFVSKLQRRRGRV